MSFAERFIVQMCINTPIWLGINYLIGHESNFQGWIILWIVTVFWVYFLEDYDTI